MHKAHETEVIYPNLPFRTVFGVGKIPESGSSEQSDNGRKRVCLIGSSSPFVSQDIKTLSNNYELTIINPPRRKGSWPRTIWRIFKSQRQCDVYFCWFAGWHSLFAILPNYRRVPVIVIVGGYDAANVPEIEYGAFRNIKERVAARYVLRHATRICVVDGSLKEDVMRNAGVDGKKILTIPTGYDPDHFKPGMAKERLVITVGGVTKAVARRKGYEFFIQAASAFPDVKFAIVGKFGDGYIDELKSKAPSNVIFTGFVSDSELLDWYQRAKVYCQLSRYEGLPNALCEAMLCGCVPVGTKHNGIPTAMADTGFYADYGDVKGTVDAIEKALDAPPERGERARDSISSRFRTEQRERALTELIETLTKDSP